MTALRPVAAAAALTVLLAACGGGGDDAAAPVPVGDTIVITESGKVASFNRTAPGVQVGSRVIGGLVAGETLLGIDARPSNGLLYALGSRGNLYTIAPSTGLATFRGTLKAAPGDDQPYISLQGTQFGVDFNPVADRLRVVSNTGQNLRINVDTGETTTDGQLVPVCEACAAVVPTVTAAAYTNAFKGSAATQLYVMDSALGQLYLQEPPNNGSLTAGTPTGMGGGGPTGLNGFDIEARAPIGYAAARVNLVVSLYRIDLASPTRAVTRIGEIAGGETITGLALVQPD
jgi:hypothetical protein